MPPTAADSTITHARLLKLDGQHVVIAVPKTDYQVQLVLDGGLPANTQPGDAIAGVVRANARRVDVMQAGGRFIEPVYGRPRRIQGRIVAGDLANNAIVVDCGVRVHAKLMPQQKTGDFAAGQLVGFDIQSGATFTPTACES